MDRTKKIKVAVLLGGNSNEREVSLESGRNIYYKLNPQKYIGIPIFVNDNMELFKLDQRLLIQNSTREISKLVRPEIKIEWSDLTQICDFVFIALHGGCGENGAIQGALEMLGLPYNGSGIFTSALCMDKFNTTKFLASHGFNTPVSFLLDSLLWEDQNGAKEKFLIKTLKSIDYPIIVKPYDDGCSIGVSMAEDSSQLVTKIDNFFSEHNKRSVLLEEFVNGMELTCAVIGNDKPRALPPSQAIANSRILSIEEKFLPGAGQNITPAPLKKESLKFIQQTTENVYLALNCKGYARIDCFFQSAQQSKTKKEKVVVLEVNTLPGMTPATCIFHQAAEVGLHPAEFIDMIIEFGLANHGVDLIKKERKVKQICT